MEKIKEEDVRTVLCDALKNGETHFTFIKKDGTLRKAVGTLNLDFVPDADKQFKHSQEEQVERTDQTSYYDLEKNAWRCCKYDSIIEINGIQVEE